MLPRLKYLSLAFACFSTFLLHGQVVFQWEQRASLPGVGRWGAFSFELNGHGYVAGGNAGGGYFSDVWKYDPLSDSWEQVASMPSDRSHGTSFSINGKGYVVTGHITGSFNSSALWEYDPNADAWAIKAPLPGNARYSPHGFSVGGYGYVGGGNMGSATGPYLSDMYKYDPIADQWTAIPGIPGQARYGATGFSIGGVGYVHGGRMASLEFENELWRFEPGSNSWTAVQSMPGPGRSWMMVMPYSNDAVIAAGADNGVGTYEAYWYTPFNDSWSSIPDYPGASGWSGASCTLLGRPFGGLGRVYPQNSYHTDWWELVKVDGTPVFEITPADVPLLKAAPNPVTDSFYIIGVDPSSDRQLQFFDGAGRMVRNTSFTSRVDVGPLSTGIYEVLVLEKGQVIGRLKIQVMDH
jgi:N-acetylneuraminic acid mutarotase